VRDANEWHEFAPSWIIHCCFNERYFDSQIGNSRSFVEKFSLIGCRMLTNLDMDVLRTLLIAHEAGSFAKAAPRIGRSQSAVSLQMSKLERQIGRPLFLARRARVVESGLKLTPTGQIVVEYARRILALNDEGVAAARGVAADGAVRLGITQDLAETWLPVVLARFARTHPGVDVQTTVGRSAAMLEALATDTLDMALVFSRPGTKQPGTKKATDFATWRTSLPITWIGPTGWHVQAGQPVPLVVFEPPCLFRQAAEEALDASGQAARVVFQSLSLAGLWASVAAGLGITIRTPLLVPAGLAVLSPKVSGLPALPNVEFALHLAASADRPSHSHLAEVLADTLETSIRTAAV
jgi:DNA-binding transcriptional LysR family regulator